MKQQPKMFSGFLILFFISALCFSQEKQQAKVDDLVSLIKQKSDLEIQLEDIGWQWKDEDIKGTADNGEAAFSDQKWLMYLIHWGPIQAPKITVDYVKERMLKMWGVKFEFTGKEGTTKIAGHEAAWAEAYGTNRSFYTRFIIWNCLESGREFIADTNYNLKWKTPEEDFEKEMRSAKTIQCHPGAKVEYFPDLAQKFESDKCQFSFYYPEEWFMFESPYYVPYPQYEGIRNRNLGSLLGLCSDQNISVCLKWFPLEETQKEEPLMGIEQKTRENLISEIQSQKDVDKFENHGMEYFTLNDKKVSKIWGNYQFKEPENEQLKAFFTGKGIYQVAQWDLANKKKKIVVILLTRQYKYGTVISSPSRTSLDKFLKDLILRTN